MRSSSAFACVITIASLASLGLAAEPVGFETARSNELSVTEATPGSLLTGDFDGDGYGDVLAYGGFDDHLTILHGSASGSLSRRTQIALETTPTSAAAADVNGDGRLDIVVGAAASFVFLDLPGPNGNPGAFDLFGAPFAPASALTSLLLSQPDGTYSEVELDAPEFFDVTGITFVDRDDDGDLDLLMHSFGSIAEFINAGDALFSAGKLLPVVFAGFDDRGLGVPNGTTGSGDFAGGVMFGGTETKFADLDGDGDTDIVGSQVFLAESDGTFSAGDLLPHSRFSIDSGDIDGDGDIDLVSIRTGSAVGYDETPTLGETDELLITLNDGTGAFRDSFVVSSVVGPLADVLLADLNDDGLPELIAVNREGAVGVLLNQGDGRFGQYAEFPHAVASLGSGLLPSVAITDANADGVPDLMTSDPRAISSAGFVWARLGSATPAPEILAIDPPSAVNGEELLLVVTGEDFDDSATLDLGPHIVVANIDVQSATRIVAHAHVAPFDANVFSAGDQVVSVAHPDGKASTTAFEIITGPVPEVESIEPAAIEPADTVDLMVRGCGFHADVDVLSESDDVTVLSVERHSDTELMVTVTTARNALPGRLGLRVRNRGMRLETESGLMMDSLTGFRVRARRGLLRDRARPGRDVLVVSGGLITPDDGTAPALDAPNAPLTLSIGGAEQPLEIVVPARDPGWRITRRGKQIWRSARGERPSVRIELDPVREQFRVTVSRTDVVLPPDGEFVIDLAAGGGQDTERVDWGMLPGRRTQRFAR